MGRKQRIEVIIRKLTLQGLETHLLQHYIAIRIGENFFANAVAPAVLGIDEFVAWNAGLERPILKGTMTFFLGKERFAVGNEESEVAGASLVNPWKVNFV